MNVLDLDPATTRGWACDDAVQAEVERRLAEAQALDAEIRDLVKARRLDKARLCDRLARMRQERLHEPLNYATFADYAVAVGAATSPRAARQQADLAQRLEGLPALRGVFTAGQADWTKLREAVTAATSETDADWARRVVTDSYDQVRAAAREARGEAPTQRISFELPLEVVIRFRRFVDAVGERLAQRVTNAEAFEMMLETAARSEPPGRRPEGGSTPDASSSPDPRPVMCPRGQGTDAVPPDQPPEGLSASARRMDDDSVPPPSATLVGYVCERCDQTAAVGPNGRPVLLDPARAATLACDAVIQEASGRRRRRIPPRIRSLVYVRDGGRCRVPGCGAAGFLHQHHEGPGGWREVGNDPDRLCLLCFGHHLQRHKGLLRIAPLGAGRFRFFRADGWELTEGPGANGTTTVARPPEHSPAADPEAERAVERERAEAG